MTTEYPGLLPWHFGGDPWLTYDEAVAYRSDLDERMAARKKHNDEMKRSSSRARRRGR